MPPIPSQPRSSNRPRSCAIRSLIIWSARIAARLTIIGTVTEVAPAIEALRRTMEKIHRSRGIAIEVDANAQAKFRGERQDLEEMAGNLVDNACKWAASRVFIEGLVEPAVEPGATPML